MDQRTNSFVWDSFDLDLIVRVLQHTLYVEALKRISDFGSLIPINNNSLSPFFAFFVPITLYAQGFGISSKEYRNASYYLAFCIALSSLKYLDKVYRNQLWKGGLKGLLGQSRINWTEQIVVITGGSSGIGLLLAETLTIQGVMVVVLDISPCVSSNGGITSYICDVTDRKAVMDVAEKIQKEVGDPTILINNAGIVRGKLLLELSEEDVRSTMDVNTISHFWTIQAFLPSMIKQKFGHIVSIASVAGEIGIAQLSDYCASKHAVIGLHESLHYELRTRYHLPDIHLTLIKPGWIATQMFATTKPLHPFINFFFPILSPHTVVKRIVAQLDENVGGEISLPFYANFTWLQRGAPLWARDLSRLLVGSDFAMSTFKTSDTTSKTK